jgi:hypothetical protein
MRAVLREGTVLAGMAMASDARARDANRGTHRFRVEQNALEEQNEEVPACTRMQSHQIVRQR